MENNPPVSGRAGGNAVLKLFSVEMLSDGSDLEAATGLRKLCVTTV